ncbi:hypothetical protein O6H91_03G024300 [Diphasiastrum complanatum]|uniref:Uncharacterized protein n=1 Tax=Diphasiastrum complanatum TaxID=34168 RepID=A0ACC2E4D2_DIPCM|nr:hypothetical protein O6H91_03G024300 [Diphasiastrum complanatum]
MAFFGITSLGEENVFASSLKCEHSSDIFAVPATRFVQVFQEMAAENKCSEIRKVLLPRIFSEAVGRQLGVNELEIMLRYFDMGPGNINLNDFKLGLQNLQGNF